MTAHHNFDYEIKRSARRRTVCLQIRDGQVQVMVPAKTSQRQIRALVDKHKDWIDRKLREQAARPKANAKTFTDGEMFTYLGQHLKLRIAEGPPWPAEQSGGQVVVTVPARMAAEERLAAVEERIREWYRVAALERFRDRVVHFSERIGVAAKAVKVKTYKRRWGSCSAKGELSFNWRLIIAPPDVIDYVAAHEVAHLVHHNHSPEFWAVVAHLMPDYRHWQDWLHRNGGLLDL